MKRSKAMTILMILAILISTTACAEPPKPEAAKPAEQAQQQQAKQPTLQDYQATDMALQIRIKALQDVKTQVEAQIRDADVARAKIEEQAQALTPKDAPARTKDEKGKK